jgi:predicted nucleic acid-binding protein
VARYCVDTSVLVKHYHPEVGSLQVITISDDPGNLLFISRVGLVEIHAALARKVCTGELQGLAFQQAIRRFYADLRGRKFRCADATLREAARQEGLSVMNPKMPQPLFLGRMLFFSNP